MDNFWEKTDEEKAATKGSYDADEGFEPLPDGTQVVALIDEAKWDVYDNNPEHMSLKWEIIEGEYKGRKIFQKIQIKSNEEKKRTKARMMLTAIDDNCGEKLFTLGHEPTDSELGTHLMNRPMVLKLRVWEIDGKSGNWVVAVDKLNRSATPATKPGVRDDDIPF